MQVLKAVLMTWTVSLDDQSMSQTQEIHDVAAKRNLAAKLQPAQSAIPQKVPEQTLRDDWRMPHRTRMGEFSRELFHSENNT
jgi:hypothetical protein